MQDIKLDKNKINQFVNDVKREYSSSIIHIENPDNPVLMIYQSTGLSYEIEIKSLHYTDTDGDLVINKCKEIFLKYKREYNLEKLLFNI